MADRKLSCSFCGKDEDHVAKLVAGPNVFICDGCFKIASDIVKHSGPGGPPPVSRAGRVLRWIVRALVGSRRSPFHAAA